MVSSLMDQLGGLAITAHSLVPKRTVAGTHTTGYKCRCSLWSPRCGDSTRYLLDSLSPMEKSTKAHRNQGDVYLIKVAWREGRREKPLSAFIKHHTKQQWPSTGWRKAPETDRRLPEGLDPPCTQEQAAVVAPICSLSSDGAFCTKFSK